ncbi:MAG TPA: hypothetical protein PLQ78_06615 [Flavipsychrobacter sp.]|jgi:hypothetical protein|nr:hypothetical protein [Flavipsychrobacter sp.]
MPAYFFQIELPETNEGIIELLPAHREYINTLFSEGKLLSYSVSHNKEQIWCVINAEDEPEAMHLVSGFPLQRYFKDVHCTSLLFHNNLPLSYASISLN